MPHSNGTCVGSDETNNKPWACVPQRGGTLEKLEKHDPNSKPVDMIQDENEENTNYHIKVNVHKRIDENQGVDFQ